VLEETDDSVILKVEKNDTLGNLGQVTIWKTSLRPAFDSGRGVALQAHLAALKQELTRC
jgi:hypothetical protein